MPADRGSFCPHLDICESINCKTGSIVCSHIPRDCSDTVDGVLNLCTIDGCSQSSGCTHVNVTCNDGDICTNDYCNPATGCVFQVRSF